MRNIVFFGWKLFGKFLFIVKNGEKVFLGRGFLEDILKYNRLGRPRSLKKRFPGLKLSGWLSFQIVK
ncbi:MAG: hypothetical protein U9R38_00600 [Candidatus Margulisiibacteriota bacterium]|nr:hypothetical protein [Candidatus Margulisiibacteriota bacterium]